MVFLIHGHLDLKKSHFDPRNQVPDVATIINLVWLVGSLNHTGLIFGYECKNMMQA
jgi:hypothetical protein